jgi:hypothetical protein
VVLAELVFRGREYDRLPCLATSGLGIMGFDGTGGAVAAAVPQPLVSVEYMLDALDAMPPLPASPCL